MFAVDFTVSQSLDGKTLTITDSSAYASPDNAANINTRVVSLFEYDGSKYLNQDFPIVYSAGAGDHVDIALDKDYAFSIVFTEVPHTSHSGSTYIKTENVVLRNNSKAKYYDREFRLISGAIACEGDYADVNYSILRWTEDAFQRMAQSDQLGSQRYLDKIFSIGLNDCVC